MTLSRAERLSQSNEELSRVDIIKKLKELEDLERLQRVGALGTSY
jgi:hypothetical protein